MRKFGPRALSYTQGCVRILRADLVMTDHARSSGFFVLTLGAAIAFAGCSQGSPPVAEPAPSSPPSAAKPLPAAPEAAPSPAPSVSSSAAAASPAAKPKESAVAVIQRDAKALAPLVRSELARAFLDAASALPSVAARRVFHDADKTKYWSEAEAARLPEAERKTLTPRELDEEFFYNTNYGTPLAYARPLDLLELGRDGLAGKKVLDFGFGGIGQLRMLASLGAEVVGVEVDPLTRALYTDPADQGLVKGLQGRDGRLSLLFGRFPADAPVRAAAGTAYDLFISKNVLKRGYIHPEQPVKERHQIKLGVDDQAFVQTVHQMLKPGGHFFIYNLTPAPNAPGKPYKTWADGRSPFPKEMLENASFQVLAYNKDDTQAARAMARALGWDKGEDPMDIENDLFAQYTLCRRRPRL